MNHYEDQNDERQFLSPGFPWTMIPGIGGPGIGGPGSGGQPGFWGPGYGGQPGWNNQGGNFPGGGGGGQQQSGPPNSPPPSFTPTQSQVQTKSIDPGGIRGCLFRNTYVWLRNDSFWFYPTFVGRQSIAGWRWRRNRWVYFGIDLDRIQSFQCF